MQAQINQIKPNGKVHPVAALYPMLLGDELNDLAADIKANGLNQPIILDKDGTLIDGQNRHAACKLAGVEPTYTYFNGHDPVEFIHSQNASRRNLSKGQRAMIVTTSYWDTEKRQLSCQSTRLLARYSGTSREFIHRACIVLQYLPDKAIEVLSRAPTCE